MGLSVRAYARHRGVSHTAVQKAVKAGRIPVLADGTIEPAAADAAWEAHAREAPPRPPVQRSDAAPRVAPVPAPAPAPGAPPTLPPGVEGEPLESPDAAAGGQPDEQRAAAARGYQTSRAVREAYLARLAKLEFEERQGKLVSADDVKVVAFNAARRARDLLMAMPDRVSSVLAATDDPVEIRRVLNAEIRRVCEELSSGSRISGTDLV